MTVPILVAPEQLESIQADQLSLCYEIHGKADHWFNMVTDQCASVNARYAGITERLNIIDEIGVRAVSDGGNCVNISVRLRDACAATVNGVPVSRYSSEGVSVRSFSNRVRVSVPNCNELTLVMWVMCERREFFVPGQGGVAGQNGMPTDTEVMLDSIKFVVMRGLNHGHRLAHGLLGK